MTDIFGVKHLDGSFAVYNERGEKVEPPNLLPKDMVVITLQPELRQVDHVIALNAADDAKKAGRTS